MVVLVLGTRASRFPVPVGKDHLILHRMRSTCKMSLWHLCLAAASIAECAAQALIPDVSAFLQTKPTTLADASMQQATMPSMFLQPSMPAMPSYVSPLQMPMPAMAEGNLRGLEAPQMMPMSATYQTPISPWAAQMPMYQPAVPAA
eukprot:Skav234150  [mRNA]  locus=scaffold2592:146956:156963:+ [translate_table: standard]